MSESATPSFRPVSRRDFLNIAAVGGGALVAIGLAGPASAEPK